MERKTIESVVQGMYSARLENNVDKCVAYFTPDAQFTMVGEEGLESQMEQPVLNNVQQKIAALVDVWQWVSMDDFRIVIDGNKISTMYTLTAVFNPSCETVVTRLADHITINNEGKITEFVEFVDTRMIQSLLAAL